ncbi:hypothetical protein VUR80DRAFT_406 [Thermomyces stellatus]
MQQEEVVPSNGTWLWTGPISWCDDGAEIDTPPVDGGSFAQRPRAAGEVPHSWRRHNQGEIACVDRPLVPAPYFSSIT